MSIFDMDCIKFFFNKHMSLLHYLYNLKHRIMIKNILNKKNFILTDAIEISRFLNENMKQGNNEVNKILTLPVEKMNRRAIICLVRYTIIHHSKLSERETFVKNILSFYKKNGICPNEKFSGLNEKLLPK